MVSLSKGYFKAWFSEHKITIILLALALLGLLIASLYDLRDSLGNWALFVDALPDATLWKHALEAVGTGLLAVGIAAGYLFLVWCFGLAYRLLADLLRGRNTILSILEALFYVTFAISALLPVSIILYIMLSLSITAGTKFLLSLLFINGLLFFLGVSHMAHIQEESSGTYVRSAEFKSFSRSNFLWESSVHFLLSSFPSIYYFVITFTLIPAMLVGNAQFWFHEMFGPSIVYSLFVTVYKTGFSSSLYWSQLFAFLFFVLLIRLIIIDTILWIWEVRYGIATGD